jgi:hypothetical protein
VEYIIADLICSQQSGHSVSFGSKAPCTGPAGEKERVVMSYLISIVETWRQSKWVGWDAKSATAESMQWQALLLLSSSRARSTGFH